jgi:hypothetical protein
MRNSKLKTVTASFAAVAMIVSLGTSAALARGGGGVGGHFGGGAGTFLGGGAGFGGSHAGGFHAGGGFHPNDRIYGGIRSHNHFYGGYNTCLVNPYNQNSANWPYSSPYMC